MGAIECSVLPLGYNKRIQHFLCRTNPTRPTCFDDVFIRNAADWWKPLTRVWSLHFIVIQVLIWLSPSHFSCSGEGRTGCSSSIMRSPSVSSSTMSSASTHHCSLACNSRNALRVQLTFELPAPGAWDVGISSPYRCGGEARVCRCCRRRVWPSGRGEWAAFATLLTAYDSIGPYVRWVWRMKPSSSAIVVVLNVDFVSAGARVREYYGYIL